MISNINTVLLDWTAALAEFIAGIFYGTTEMPSAYKRKVMTTMKKTLLLMILLSFYLFSCSSK
jgi:hypothetical protein